MKLCIYPQTFLCCASEHFMFLPVATIIMQHNNWITYENDSLLQYDHVLLASRSTEQCYHFLPRFWTSNRDVNYLMPFVFRCVVFGHLVSLVWISTFPASNLALRKPFKFEGGDIELNHNVVDGDYDYCLVPYTRSPTYCMVDLGAIVRIGRVATVLHLGHGAYDMSSWSWWRHQMEKFSAALAFVRGIHRSPVNSPHKGPVTRSWSAPE